MTPSQDSKNGQHATSDAQAATSELQFAYDQLREAQRVAHVGSWTWTVADNEWWWSEELFRICGFEPNAFQPTYDAFVALLHPEDRDHVVATVQQGLQQHQPFDCEHRLIRPSGEVRTFHCRGRVITDKQGDVVRMVGTAQDITERKATEEVVSRSERRLQTIIDTEPACVKLVSPDGLLLDLNRAGLEMVEAEDVSQLVGRAVIGLVHPDDRARYLELHRAAINGSPGRREFRIIGLKGGERWVDSRAVPLERSTDTGTQRAVLSVTTDITERKRLEDQLRQAQKLDALGRLVGSISHDFNNFITALIGYTELALKQIGDDETIYPDLKNDLQEVLNIGHRAAALTRQLLMFSRRPTLAPPVISLDAVVGPLQSMLQPLLGEKIRVHLRLDSGETRVRLDPNHLEQLVVNLAVNARDAMPNGGEITIATTTTALDDKYAADRPSTASPGVYALLMVSDTGRGMDDYVKAHLFEPFFTTKPPDKGTGLGLATVYGIVKQSGGYVWVDTEVGRGTKIKLYFPLVPELPALDVKPHHAPRNVEDYPTVLVVDDDEHVRAVARDVLQEHGYHVIDARTGEEAARLAATVPESVDLLVTDVILPGMNGRDLRDRLRLSRPTLRTLFISGYGQRAIVNEGVLESTAVLLEKPFTSAELLSHVRAALSHAQ